MRFSCALAIAVLCLTELHAQTKLGAQYDNSGCGQDFAVDKDGVTVVTYPDLGTQYNPVTIAQTALGCYHEYKRSGSEQARRKYLEQIHWLREHYLRVSDDMAAYAYQFAWAGYGLASGWHSGLAQGQAISALIRYYYDTGDKSVLPLINELKNFLFLPQEKGGVLRTTPEGGIWFEEYPSDPPSFVWNGNVSTIFGLYEFTGVFPNDDKARSQLEDAVDSLKASLPAYDTGTWTILDRRARPYPEATNGYAFAHASQMRSLADITGSPFFRSIWLRWQSFYSDANFDADGNMVMGDDGFLHLLPRRIAQMPPDRLKGVVDVVSQTETFDGYGLDKLFDRKDDTYFAPSKYGTTDIHLHLKTPFKANVLSLGLYNPSLYPKALQIATRSCDKADLAPVDYERTSDRLVISYYFPRQTICELNISSAENAGQDRMILSELSLGDVGLGEPGLPQIGSYATPVYEIAEPNFRVRLTAKQKPYAAAAMYRCADTAAKIEEHGWVFDMLDPVRAESRPAPAHYCQFKFLTDPQSAAAGWKVAIEGGTAVPQKPTIESSAESTR